MPRSTTERGSQAPVIVVMGVSGAGKSTVGKLLADRLGLPFGDADDFHPPSNVALMSAGRPLSDADREPWLHAIGEWLAECKSTGGAVMACSALKRWYRDLLREYSHDAWFLHLTGIRRALAARMDKRADHFMPASLLDSQLADLEPLAPDEHGATLDVTSSPPDLLADRAVRLLDAERVRDA